MTSSTADYTFNKIAKNCKKLQDIATYFHEILLQLDLLGGSSGHNSHAAFRAEVNFVITEILQLVKNVSVAISCDFSAILCY
jgi:hypothetical protein